MRNILQALTLLAVTASVLLAENITYPASSTVVNLRTAFNVPRVGEGDGDATAEIQAAMNAHSGGDRTLYLPNGTYLVSNRIVWGDTLWAKRIALQGQSMDSTVILLKDNCPGYGDSTVSKAVLWTGAAPAQRFRNAIRNLTVRVGRGNPGACGIQFIANNQGHIMNVKIISDDGRGRVGLDMWYTAEVGPLYVRNVTIDGFDVGITHGAPQNSQTMEHITLRNQRKCGIINSGQVVTIRDLVSVNKVTVIENNVPTSVMTLLDANLTTPAGDTVIGAAIKNYAWLYARNVVTRGYKQAITGRNPGDQAMLRTVVDEYRSNRVDSLFYSPPSSLNLPVEEPPAPVWDPADQWVTPMSYGAAGNNSTDDTRAIQAAIDAGKSTVFFNGDKVFLVNGTVLVRGAVRTLIGLEGNVKGSGTFQIVDGTSPVVYWLHTQSYLDDVKLRHTSSRTLVVEGVTGMRYEADPGAGKVFLTDYCASPVSFAAGQKVFLRQYNPEGLETKTINSGATVWLLGMKTERLSTNFETSNGGITEIHGLFTYATEGDPTMPMLTINNASMSITGFGGSCFNTAMCWQTLVQETRNGVTRKLTRDNQFLDSRTGEPVLTLFSGWNAAAVGTEKAAIAPRRNVLGNRLTVAAGAAAKTLPRLSPGSVAYNIRGQVVGAPAKAGSMVHRVGVLLVRAR